MSTAYKEKFSSILRCRGHKVEPVDRLSSFHLIRINHHEPDCLINRDDLKVMTSAEQVRPTCKKLWTPFRPHETMVVVDFAESNLCQATQCDETDIGAVLPAIRACAFVAGAVSVLNSSEWERSCTCPFVLLSAGEIFVFSPNLSGIQWQIAVYKPHGHDNNWLLYSAS